MDSKPKKQISTKVAVDKNDRIHHLRRAYTSGTATEFLHTRKMNEKHIYTLHLNLPLKPHFSLPREQIFSLIYRWKNLKSLSTSGFALQPSSNPGSILLKSITLHLQSFRGLLKLRLAIPLQNRNASKELENLSSALRYMTLLSTLNILFWGDNTARNFHDFFQTLRYLQYLAILTLGFCNMKQVDDQFIKEFSFSLKSLQNLSSLDFSLYQCDNAITDGGLEYLSTALKKIRSLLTIKLALSPLKELTDRGLTHLSDALYNHHNLTSLYLDLSGSKEITNKGALHLAFILQEFKVLSHLGLKLFDFEGDSDHSLKSFLSKLYHIKSIYLPLYFVRSQDLRDGILGLKSLTKLSLSFFKCTELTDETLYNLSLGLKSLQKLGELNLIFFLGDRFTNQGMKELGASFRNLVSLTSFSLYLFRCGQIDDIGVKGLLEGIESMKDLKYLTIKLESMDKITDVSVQSVACCLDALKISLASLHLTLRDKCMTNQGALILATSLSSLHCLSYISLEVPFSPNVDNEVVRNLVLGLKDLPSLASFKLNVNYCENIGEEAINSLSIILREFKTLGTICLDFSRCKAGFKNRLHDLAASLKSLNSLSGLTLNFDWDYEIDKQLMDSLVLYRKDWRVKFGR